MHQGLVRASCDHCDQLNLNSCQKDCLSSPWRQSLEDVFTSLGAAGSAAAVSSSVVLTMPPGGYCHEASVCMQPAI